MKIEKTSIVYFSGSGMTKQVMQLMGGTVSKKISDFDITPLSERSKKRTFKNNELVIFGAPVFGGRLPAPMAETLSCMHGDHTPAIIVVTYGNRAYEDALVELQDLISRQGFVPMAAAAFVAEHSIVHDVASGRPDDLDRKEIIEFTKAAAAKIANVQTGNTVLGIEVKGHRPYKTFNGVPLKPKASKACNHCGLCVKRCPVGAIDKENPRKTEVSKCISCMACIRVCPQKIRGLNPIKLAFVRKKMIKNCSQRQSNDIVL